MHSHRWWIFFKGQMLTLVEYTMLLYRALLPAPIWYRFFLNKDYGSLFSSLTTGLYLTFKLTSVVEKVWCSIHFSIFSHACLFLFSNGSRNSPFFFLASTSSCQLLANYIQLLFRSGHSLPQLRHYHTRKCIMDLMPQKSRYGLIEIYHVHVNTLNKRLIELSRTSMQWSSVEFCCC